MSKKILVIPFDRLEEKNIQIKDVNKVPLMGLKEFAVADWTVDELIDYINTAPDFRELDEETHLFYTYEQQDDEIFEDLQEDNSIEVILNNELQLHIKRNELDYTVDFYKWATDEEMSADDYDFDSDYIKSVSVLDEELQEESEED